MPTVGTLTALPPAKGTPHFLFLSDPRINCPRDHFANSMEQVGPNRRCEVERYHTGRAL